MDLPHHSGKSVYVLTNDLGERIASLRLLGLKTPDAQDSFFSGFHDGIKREISRMLPSANVIAYDMKDLAERIWSEALSIRKNLKDAVVISSCADMSSPRRGHLIEINRIVDQNGDIIGLGPRPGNPSLDSQFNGISSVVNGNPVVLVEDGAFTGSTLAHLLSQFRKRKINVTAVVVGICFQEARNNIQKDYKGEFVVVQEVDQLDEWMPDHDFVPFAPNCGRVYGGKFGKDILPHYSHDALSYSFPYVLPFGDPTKWASIPKEHAGPFSIFCLQKTLELFQKMDEMNGKEICIMDLVGSNPRVSVPMTMGNGQLPSGDVPISRFLAEVCHEF